MTVFDLYCVMWLEFQSEKSGLTKIKYNILSASKNASNQILVEYFGNINFNRGCIGNGINQGGHPNKSREKKWSLEKNVLKL